LLSWRQDGKDNGLLSRRQEV